jgi:hypothetical protein
LFGRAFRDRTGHISYRRGYISKIIPISPNQTIKSAFATALEFLENSEDLQDICFDDFLSNNFRGLSTFEGVTEKTTMLAFKNMLEISFSRIRMYFCVGEIVGLTL